ncbi:type II secretion system protein [Legionella rowbothamii]|uniref:type II secretion system protein n=1 Tax=Legionella rowbothamii TaxID=96229 RepID=UPI0010567192|nr:type II secretion system protein [Legionella rowbothamii]
MKRHQKGFIFLIVLLITAVISLLVASSMHHLLLYLKVTNHQEVLHQRFYQLEAVALQLVQQKPFTLGCIRHQDSANHALNRLLQHQGCSFNDGELTYQYFIEDLGSFDCLVVYEQGQKRSSHHLRVSIALMEEGRPVSFLQIRYINSRTLVNCEGNERLVRLGMSSWRYLGSI